jgi:hypothetical protein
LICQGEAAAENNIFPIPVSGKIQVGSLVVNPGLLPLTDAFIIDGPGLSPESIAWASCALTAAQERIRIRRQVRTI